MDDEYLQYVDEAIDCLVKDEPEPIREDTDIRRFDVLMQRIVDGFPSSPDDLKISRRSLSNKIKHFLNDIKNEDNPQQEFNQRYGSLIGGIMSSPKSTFRIGFPLNIPDGPDLLKHRGNVVEKVSKTTWDSEFKQEALGNDGFENLMGKSPNDLSDQFTYWMFECDARDHVYAVTHLENILEVILGELIYCMSSWNQQNFRSNPRLHPYAWSELKLPFIYIVLENGQYVESYNDEDVSERERISMGPRKQQKLENRYTQIPEFNSPNQFELNIVSGFRNFYLGATEHNNQQAFFHYWRALENLSLTDDGNSSIDVLNRVSSVVDFSRLSSAFGLTTDKITAESRINTLKNKRNELVHKGTNITITKEDNGFLRILFYHYIPFAIVNKDWKEENIEFWLQNAGKDRGRLKNSHSDHKKMADDHNRKKSIIGSIMASQKLDR